MADQMTFKDWSKAKKMVYLLVPLFAGIAIGCRMRSSHSSVKSGQFSSAFPGAVFPVALADSNNILESLRQLVAAVSFQCSTQSTPKVGSPDFVDNTAVAQAISSFEGGRCIPGTVQIVGTNTEHSNDFKYWKTVTVCCHKLN